ncbi:MAG TPA: ribbon-helix-helix protein, CopG family [Syntrophobacteraceae bacterium]|nr:ribbon-helix-helix protein, CopG family [Syntrophobacteraceae bacterium]
MSTQKRISVYLDADLADAIRRLAYWSEKTIPEIILPGVEKEIRKYERVHGPLKPIPSGKSIRKGRPRTGSVYDRARLLAYNLGVPISEVIREDIEKQIKRFERDRGPMKPIPTRKNPGKRK